MAKHSKDKISDETLTPDGLFQSFCEDKNDNAWLREQILEAGPRHKQVQQTLVLNRLEALVAQTAAKTGQSFAPLPGEPIIIAKHDHDLMLPLAYPASTLDLYPSPGWAGELVKGPDHEIAYTAMLLQAIEWLLKAGGSK